MGKDIFPRLAARLDSAIATDVTSVEASGDDIVVKKPVFAGKAIANLELKGATNFCYCSSKHIRRRQIW